METWQRGRRSAKTIALSAGSLGLCFLLSACANTSRVESERAQTDLIGLSKSDLLACAGVPEKTGTSDRGREFFSYSSEKIVHVPTGHSSHTFYPGFGYYGHRGAFFHIPLGPTTQAETRKCTATFALQNNRVVSLSYNMNDSDYYGIGQCYQIVRNCLPPAKKAARS